MKYAIMIMTGMFFCFLSAYMHELDMLAGCEKTGVLYTWSNANPIQCKSKGENK